MIRLVAAGYEREAATRLVCALFLGPDASEEDIFAVAQNVLDEKRRAAREGHVSYVGVGK